EVAKHNSNKDCWVVVDGKVYDVTLFIPNHPGGKLIYARAGYDISILFQSYHFGTTP
ncbi:UNVERIFIED_CONTAM: hypothetical protein GTU68_042885, partial [Idotea baltica]|nr:hypothetical protein [Idotea baltica]